VAERLKLENFKASNRWLGRFKRRHGLTYKNLCGESASVDTDTVDYWKTESLLRNLEDYKPNEIFNADETGIFFSLLPSKTCAIRGDPCHGGKKSKERLNALLCVNSDSSEKLPPLVVGKYAKPRCFKNVQTLPCKYSNNKNAWMALDLFKTFLRLLDAKMGAANKKTLLFIDKCPAHAPDTAFLHNIKVVIFPASCTSHL
jgi:hypothetical protein